MKHNLLKSVILSVILLMGVSNAWAWTATFRCVPELTFGSDWSSTHLCKVHLTKGDYEGEGTYDMYATGVFFEHGGKLYEICAFEGFLRGLYAYCGD